MVISVQCELHSSVALVTMGPKFINKGEIFPKVYNNTFYFCLLLLSSKRCYFCAKSLRQTLLTQDSNCLQPPGQLHSLVVQHLLQQCKGHRFKSHPSDLPTDFAHRTLERTEYTVLNTHQCIKDKTNYILSFSQLVYLAGWQHVFQINKPEP